MMSVALSILLLAPGTFGRNAAVSDRGQVLLSVQSRLSSTQIPENLEVEMGAKDWEAFAGTGNRACRGTRREDNKDEYYEVHSGIFSVEDCKALCLDDQPRCKGIEYSEGRCEIWVREKGIAAFSEPSLEGITFTCLRYGWPALYLQPIDGGVDRGCRGDHPNDKSRSYFVKSVVRNLEDCRALCVAADVCRGLQFSMYADESHGRCEIWKRAIEATREQQGTTCLRYEPPASIGQ